MRTPAEAIAEILGRIQPLRGKESVSLRHAAGRVLAVEVASDVDLPPFEKSAMDGFALRAADASEPGAVLACAGESRAGAPFDGAVPAGSCVAIYTGAELPGECDAVVMVEDTERDGDRVRLAAAVTPGQHVSHTGEILRAGGAVASPGLRLSPADLSVLAAVGAEPLEVFRRPRVAVLTTGDELVPVTEKPGRGQIREGNTLYLAAACERAGCEVVDVGIVSDSEEELLARFGAALDGCDALLTTGGVSMGKYDLVGTTFERLGVEPVLHKVAIKPGKPIWFGLRGPTPVFGLPGNPVSSLLGFEVFVRPALVRLAGDAAPPPAPRRGVWDGAPTQRTWRQQNLPAVVAPGLPGSDGRDRLTPVPWRGSADIVGASRATAFAVVEPETTVEPGDEIEYRPLA